jgi:periplasmic protein TonB
MAEFRDDEEPQGLKKYWPYMVGGVIAVGFAGVVYALVQSLSGSAPPPKPQIQQISLVQPPPPPPPPPKMEEEPPPEPEMEEVVENEPEPVPDDIAESDEAPPGDDLALDADGVAGSDGFGLAARKGGKGLIGGAGSRFGWYAGLLKNDIHAALAEVDDIRKDRYSVIVRIWVGEDGTVTESEIVRGTGKAEVDRAISDVLRRQLRLSEAPPADMPQPIKIRITSRT